MHMVRVPKMRHPKTFFFSRPVVFLQRSTHVQSICVFMAGVRHKSSTLLQTEIARDRGPEALGAIHL